jgi:hypothetical protein
MLSEFMEGMKRYVSDATEEMHTAIPARVEAYDPAKGTVDALPYARRRKPGGGHAPYPLCAGVPAMFPQGAGQEAEIAFPVRNGDGCLLIFAEKALDAWRSGAESPTELSFDLSSAVALVGLFARPGPAAAEAAERGALVLRMGASKIALLGGGGVEISGDVAVSGTLTVGGSLTAAGLGLDGHTHISGAAGADTGPPK